MVFLQVSSQFFLFCNYVCTCFSEKKQRKEDFSLQKLRVVIIFNPTHDYSIMGLYQEAYGNKIPARKRKALIQSPRSSQMGTSEIPVQIRCLATVRKGLQSSFWQTCIILVFFLESLPPPFFFSSSGILKLVRQTSSITIAWKHIRNAYFQTPPQNVPESETAEGRPSNLCFLKYHPGSSDAYSEPPS